MGKTYKPQGPWRVRILFDKLKPSKSTIVFDIYGFQLHKLHGGIGVRLRTDNRPVDHRKLVSSDTS